MPNIPSWPGQGMKVLVSEIRFEIDKFEIKSGEEKGGVFDICTCGDLGVTQEAALSWREGEH